MSPPHTLNWRLERSPSTFEGSELAHSSIIQHMDHTKNLKPQTSNPKLRNCSEKMSKGKQQCQNEEFVVEEEEAVADTEINPSVNAGSVRQT